MSEHARLLPGREENGGSGEEGSTTTRQTDSENRKRTLRCLAITLVALALTLAISVTVAALSGTIVYGIFAHLYHNNTCDYLSLSASAYTRSGSFSSLIEIPSEKALCYKPPLHVTLDSYSATVGIYQTPCEGVDTDPFQTSYELSDRTINNGPITVFNENYSPQNYFYGEGKINVDIINLTSSKASVNVAVCLFTSIDEYNDFKRAGENWKNFTSTAKCNSITVESGKSAESTIDVFDNSFVFVGMASMELVHISTLNVSATGRDIAKLGENSTKVCELNGDRRECTFNLQASSDRTDVCIVAYQDDNPDGSYDYSNVILSLLKRDHVAFPNPYDGRIKIFGISFGGLMLLWLVLIAVVICTVTIVVVHRRRRDLDRHPTHIQASEDDRGDE